MFERVHFSSFCVGNTDLGDKRGSSCLSNEKSIWVGSQACTSIFHTLCIFDDLLSWKVAKRSKEILLFCILAMQVSKTPVNDSTGSGPQMPFV